MDATNELNDRKRAEAEGTPASADMGIPSPSHDPAYAPNPRNLSPSGAPFPQAPQEAPNANPATALARARGEEPDEEPVSAPKTPDAEPAEPAKEDKE